VNNHLLYRNRLWVPIPFPMMVRDFQRVVGIEAREQFSDMTVGTSGQCGCLRGRSPAMQWASHRTSWRSMSANSTELSRPARPCLWAKMPLR
jgi:hypothetical protein